MIISIGPVVMHQRDITSEVKGLCISRSDKAQAAPSIYASVSVIVDTSVNASEWV